MSKSELEQRFDQLIIDHQPHLYPQMMAYYRFHPKRQWEADRAWLNSMVFVELDGGTWVGGRHTRGLGYDQDSEKHMAAMCLGFVVVRFSTSMLAPERASSFLSLLAHLIACRASTGTSVLQVVPEQPPALTYEQLTPARNQRARAKRASTKRSSLAGQHVTTAARKPRKPKT